MGIEIAQPLGEASYCSAYFVTGGVKKFYVLNLDTMNLVKTAPTYVELWGV